MDFVHPFTVSSLVKIHEKLFKDIYSFAGKIREVSLVKDQTRFCEPQFIEEQLNDIMKELDGEESFKSLSQASKRLAYFKTELNMIHPFREGNGRTIRIFIREFAKHMGYRWDFENLDRYLYLEAMIASQNDTSKLERLFLESLYSID